MSNQSLEIVREPDRFRLTGLSRVQWWRLEREGKAPKRIKLSANSVGWLRGEIEDWIAERVGQRGNGQSLALQLASAARAAVNRGGLDES
ncbi:MAG: AlpA family phage regulatory protein [Nitrospira sp.]|nr:AlpA family phage regulatory protein [Nitrospira sp.]